MPFRLVFLGLVALAGVAVGAPGWNAGDRVFARQGEEIYAYPATVIGAKNRGYEVLFDVGGKRAEVGAASLTTLRLEIGTHVYGNWQKRGHYYPGTVTLKSGEQVRIQYEDGDQEMAGVGDVRVVVGKVDVRCVAGEAIFAAIDPSGRIFYPVTVRGVEKERVRVSVAGSNEMLVPADLTRAFSLAAGDRVLGRWQNGPAYFPGRVRKVTKERVELRYDDGDVEWTSAGLTMLLTEGAKPGETAHCLDTKREHVARKEPLQLPPLPAPPRGPRKPSQSI